MRPVASRRSIEASADEALLNQYRNQLKEDAFVVLSARLQPDHFSGGLRAKVQQVWDLAGARCRFGKHLRVLPGARAPEVTRLLREYPPRRELLPEGELQQGLKVRIALRCQGRNDDGDGDGNGAAAALAELQLGEGAAFYPSDAALAAWAAQTGGGSAAVVYE